MNVGQSIVISDLIYQVSDHQCLFRNISYRTNKKTAAMFGRPQLDISVQLQYVLTSKKSEKDEEGSLTSTLEIEYIYI